MSKGYIVRRGNMTNSDQTVVTGPNYTMLYNKGDECTDVTGGWVEYKKSTARQFAAFRSNNKINLSDYRKAFFIAHAYGTEPVVYAICSVSDAISVEPINVSYVDVDAYTITSGDVNLTGEYYIYLGTHWSSGGGNTIIATKRASYLDVELKDSIDNRGGNIHTLALFKADNWQALMDMCGLSGYDTIGRLLENSNAVSTLLSNKSACEYMVSKCTGDVMMEAILSSTFKTALKNSPYKDLFNTDEHWSKFLGLVS